MKGKGGRPSKFTPDRIAKALEARRCGLSVSACAAHAGVASSTLEKWLSDGTKAKAGTAKAKFSGDFRAAYTHRRVEVIRDALSGEMKPHQVKFAIWWLSVTSPSELGAVRSDGKSAPRADTDLDQADKTDADKRAELMRVLMECPPEVLRAALAMAEAKEGGA